MGSGYQNVFTLAFAFPGICIRFCVTSTALDCKVQTDADIATGPIFIDATNQDLEHKDCIGTKHASYVSTNTYSK